MRSSLLRLFATSAAAASIGAGMAVVSPSASAEDGDASQLLAGLVVASEATGPAYDRDHFQHWIDVNDDGCDTRQEVLLTNSQAEPVMGENCSILEGMWWSYLDDQTWTDPSDVDIDHTVPLEEAWQSGAWQWTAQQRQDYANDMVYHWSLVPVTASVHSSKGSSDPAEWMPPYADIACDYASFWIGVKYRWNLTIDSAEKTALSSVLENCPNDLMDVPPKASTPTPTPSPADTDYMFGGQQLTAGQWLMSPDRTHGLAFQADGNLVAYGPNYRPLWSSGTYGNPGAVFTFQPDGNAVIYAANGAVLWHAGTYGNPGASLQLHNDGNVVIYRSNFSAAWHSGGERTGFYPGVWLLPGQQVTSANGRYWLILQRDGNVVVYARDGRPIFFTGSYNSTSLTLQPDGNLVAYRANGTAAWNSGTWREGSLRLDVQNDGNVVLYRGDGSAAWYSGWDAGQRATSPSNGTYVPRPAR
jgi:hypothetical protein